MALGPGAIPGTGAWTGLDLGTHRGLDLGTHPWRHRGPDLGNHPALMLWTRTSHNKRAQLLRLSIGWEAFRWLESRLVMLLRLYKISHALKHYSSARLASFRSAHDAV